MPTLLSTTIYNRLTIILEKIQFKNVLFLMFFHLHSGNNKELSELLRCLMWCTPSRNILDDYHQALESNLCYGTNCRGKQEQKPEVYENIKFIHL